MKDISADRDANDALRDACLGLAVDLRPVADEQGGHVVLAPLGGDMQRRYLILNQAYQTVPLSF